MMHERSQGYLETVHALASPVICRMKEYYNDASGSDEESVFP